MNREPWRKILYFTLSHFPVALRIHIWLYRVLRQIRIRILIYLLFLKSLRRRCEILNLHHSVINMKRKEIFGSNSVWICLYPICFKRLNPRPDSAASVLDPDLDIWWQDIQKFTFKFFKILFDQQMQYFSSSCRRISSLKNFSTSKHKTYGFLPSWLQRPNWIWIQAGSGSATLPH